METPGDTRDREKAAKTSEGSGVQWQPAELNFWRTSLQMHQTVTAQETPGKNLPGEPSKPSKF